MTENVSDFSGFPWHDATILAVDIDRHAPGQNDEVSISIGWSDGRETCLRFRDCYAADIRMNFGISAVESIRDARCFRESPELTELRKTWSRIGVDLSDLRCFELSTNSTASTIRIYALGYESSELHDQTKSPETRAAHVG
jgi:hypothetical protein